MPVPTEKIALFIDGANLYATAKTLGFDIDYKRLLREFQSRGYLLRAFYYTAVIEDQEYSSIRPLIDWLDYNGYTVVTKATKEFVDQAGRRKVKGNMASGTTSLPASRWTTWTTPMPCITCWCQPGRNCSNSSSPRSRRRRS